MIIYVQGDLFTSPAEVLVNTVNTVGVMGKGIAKEFKHIYPEMFDAYQHACESGDLRIGTLMLHRHIRKSVLNFPTKRHWRSPSRVEDIEAGLKKFTASYEEYGISSIAFPQLGCGNGELDWESQVRPLMERHLGNLPIRIYVHLYDAGGLLPEHHDRKSMKSWLRSEPENLPSNEAWEDLVDAAKQHDRLGDWTISLVNETILDESDPDGGESVQVLAIRFVRDEIAYSLTENDFASLWRRTRTGGLFSSGSLPAAAKAISAPVLDLLAKLDYLVPTNFAEATASGARAVMEFTPGLKLVPRSAPGMAQRSLVLG